MDRIQRRQIDARPFLRPAKFFVFHIWNSNSVRFGAGERGKCDGFKVGKIHGAAIGNLFLHIYRIFNYGSKREFTQGKNLFKYNIRFHLVKQKYNNLYKTLHDFTKNLTQLYTTLQISTQLDKTLQYYHKTLHNFAQLFSTLHNFTILYTTLTQL